MKDAASTVEQCFESIAAQEYPRDRLEVIVGDGLSTDGSPERARDIVAAAGIRCEIVTNHVGTTPSNLNRALEQANGAIVCRVDSRSVLPPEYVSTCVDVLMTRPEIVVVGGSVMTLVQGHSTVDIGVVRALNNRFAMGGAPYRSGGSSGPTDTVYLGAFRKDELREVGGWDEVMLLNQDYELNRRMGRQGLVWFDACLEVGYLSRRTVPAVFSQYVRFGRWKVKYWRRFGDRPQSRQLGRMAVPPLVVGLAGAWVLSGAVVRRSATASGLAVGALLAIDHRGTQAPRQAGLGARLVGATTLGAIGLGWLIGILLETVAGDPLPVAGTPNGPRSDDREQP